MTTASTADFLRALFEYCEGPAFFQSLSNDGSEHPREVFTRSPTEVQAFVRKWDRAGRGLFYCVSTLKPDSHKRSKETVNQVCTAWADIDFKGLENAPADGGSAILGVLQSLPCPPSMVVRSGHGLHPYWLFHEPLEVGAGGGDVERLEGVLRQLADLVGGDLAVCEVSRLMRLPGTHNTKGGDKVPVEIVHFEASRRYELSDLEDMLGLLDPVIKRKPPAPRTSEPLNPFLAAASALGFKPPLDVEAELLAMHPGNINATQLRCSASMLNKGLTVDEVVALIMEATHRAASMDDRVWRNWRGEERKVRKLCEEWLRKHPADLKPAGPAPQVRDAGEPAVAPSSSDSSNVVGLSARQAPRTTTNVIGSGGEVVNMDEVKRAVAAKKRPKGKADKDDPATLTVASIIEGYKRDGRELMVTGDGLWIYEAGMWRMEHPGDVVEVDVAILTLLRNASVSAKNSLVSQINHMLRHDPDIYVKAPAWNDGYLVCNNVALKVAGMREALPEVFPHSPDLYARSCIAANYDAEAGCPLTLEFLGSLFADKADAEARTLLLQEIFGAALATKLLPREARKATFIWSEQASTGKSEIARLLKRLVSGVNTKVIGVKIHELKGQFALQQFQGASAWIADDATKNGGEFDASLFKVLVTGEDVTIERKRLDAFTTSVAIPVLLTMNSLPRVWDDSDAVYRRTIAIDLTNVVSEDEAAEWRLARGVTGEKVADWLFEQEAAGILNWALEGLQRVLDRGGRFDVPASVAANTKTHQKLNDPIREWAELALVEAPFSRVSMQDVTRAYAYWRKTEDGEHVTKFGGRKLAERLRSMFKGAATMRSNGTAWLCGVVLNGEGIFHWDRGGDMGPGAPKGFAATKADVIKSYFPKDGPKVDPDAVEFPSDGGP